VSDPDLVRIWGRMDDDEGPIFLSSTDLLRAMQPHMTSTSEAAFKLLRQEIPLIVRASVREYIAEQEAEKQRIAAQLGLVIDPDGLVRPRRNPVRKFVSDHAVSLVLFFIVLLISAPDVLEWVFRSMGFLRWFTGS
jgi:hypothetical protein